MVSELASHINKNLFDVRVICIYGQREDNEMERAVEDSGASIMYLGFAGSENRFKGISQTWSALNSLKPDVVHTHLGAVQYCLPWVLAHGVKLVHTVHNVPEIETPGSALKKIMAWMYRTGRAVPVAISKQNRVLTARYYKLAENVVELVNNPVDVEFFHPSNKSDLRDFRFDFINVAGLRPQKNQKLLLRAFANTVARHPASRLCIVGDGSERQELENLANELGLSDAVEFLGRFQRRRRFGTHFGLQRYSFFHQITRVCLYPQSRQWLAVSLSSRLTLEACPTSSVVTAHWFRLEMWTRFLPRCVMRWSSASERKPRRVLGNWPAASASMNVHPGMKPFI